ncbi:predicted protein [Histoplasma capsulatum H143]|uniref:Uncharacterized protein n=1 Tax=Ajellomyces capsulatus (strain H143) TaxID=544712 RepID=C6HH73_AJECH|nr:predicted protein [Histoplasma capsulatum H143]
MSITVGSGTFSFSSQPCVAHALEMSRLGPPQPNRQRAFALSTLSNQCQPPSSLPSAIQSPPACTVDGVTGWLHQCAAQPHKPPHPKSSPSTAERHRDHHPAFLLARRRMAPRGIPSTILSKQRDDDPVPIQKSFGPGLDVLTYPGQELSNF